MQLKQTTNRKKKINKTFYYLDEQNDDFFTLKTSLIVKIDENYQYLPKSWFGKICSWFLYYLIAIPFLALFTFFCGTKVYNKKSLKKLKKQGYIVFGNHTHFIDAFAVQVRITAPKRTYIISNKEAVSKRVVRTFTKVLGALPIADTLSAHKNMNKSIETILNKNQVVVVYPEAHIWPYYTGVRPFPATSFKLAAKNRVPVVPVATTFKKRKFGKKPRIIQTIGEPIYFDENLSTQENAIRYRDYCYNYIKQQVEKSDNYVYNEYIKVETNEQMELYKQYQNRRTYKKKTIKQRRKEKGLKNIKTD